MNKALTVAIIAAAYAFIGLLAVSLEIVGIPTVPLPEVAEPSGGLIDGILRALIYAFNAAFSLIVLMFIPLVIFALPALGFPPALGLLLSLVVNFVLFYIIVRLIRGGG